MATKHSETRLLEGEGQLGSDNNGDSNVLLQVKDVAALLGIHPNTVRLWTDTGVLKSYRVGPRKDRRIPLVAVKQMLASV